ncbi:MAG TPA: TIGR03960 family B12-binding radical SAM protein [Polyangiaceae bacterium]|jgi:radical SAM family uncharacterized protein/radical SAM-linked protein
MTAPQEHPYASFVHLVQKPARYLGGEFGAAVKDWASVQAKVCLAFPDLYDIGMSHLGFKILYKILNDDPRTLAERAYAPWTDMQAELRARGLPLLSLETARPLRDFDVVGFSLQFELTYTNVLAMLDLGGVPLRARDRGEGDPLVIAGGPTATHPEPVSAFLDALVIGDGEERLTEVALLWTELRAAGVPRAERLVALAKLRGVYVPSLYATKLEADTGFTVVDRALVPEAWLPVERSLVDDLNRFPFPDDGPVGGPEAIFDRMSIEIARGCTEGCRFCQAGMIYRPVRERDPEQIVETIVSAVKKSGYDEASLTCLSTADYSCIAPLIKKVVNRLAPEKVSLGVSSLRAYGLDEDVLDDLQRVRASGVTFAPEAGSQRMRDVVNKNVTEEQLMTTAERIFSRGWSSMKLYFMIGLPTEEESDVREIVRVGARARETGRRVKKERNLGGAPKVTVSVSTHVPKPHTPFQWCAMDPAEQVRAKQRWLQEEARQSNGVDLRMHDSETSWLEGVFARGDRRLCDVLERAYRAGACFDSWEDQLKIEVWEQAFAAEGIDPATYLGTIPVTARLPWDHISVGLEEGFLAREYRKALASRLSPPCGKAAGAFVHATNLQDAEGDRRKLVCYDCGVACDLSAMRQERLVYLRKLGAEEPVQAKPLPPPVSRESGKKKGPPPRIVQGEARRYRFGYTKLGPSAFLSHLDLIRALPRAFRRLSLPLYYSSGYHPKPEMVFGPALSLGVASLGEVVDMKVAADFDPAALVEALGEGAPDGIRFTGGVVLGPQDAGVSRIIDSARYAVSFARSALADRGGEAWLAGEVARLLDETEHKVLRRIDGVGKWVNVREFLRGIAVGGDDAQDAVARAGMVGDLVTLLVDVEIRGSGSVKISEVVEALAGTELPHRAVRVALGVWKDGAIASPLDLPAVRRGRTAVRGSEEQESAAADGEEEALAQA